MKLEIEVLHIMDENESCGLESKKYRKAVSVTEGSSMAETDLVKNTYTISKTSLMRSGAPTISKNLIENEYTSKESLVTRRGSPEPGSVLRHTFPQLEKERENKVYETMRSYPKPFADISLPKQPAIKVNIADTVQERQVILPRCKLLKYLDNKTPKINLFYKNILSLSNISLWFLGQAGTKT